MSFKITGKLPSGKDLERLKQSSNYNGRGFKNLTETPMKPQDVSYWKMITEVLKRNRNTAPPRALPFEKTNLHTLDASEPILVWFGHSSYFIRIEEKNFLIDPVFSGNAAPVSFMVKAFPGSNEYKVENMPPIDYLILTHDHYDHLDYKTIIRLKNKVTSVYCSLGVSAHLKYWGYDGNRITELDWWQSSLLDNNLKLIAAPARHFSGRGIKRAQTLWSSFILKSANYNLYLGGDSGYESHFKEIGEKHGPFDIAILEAGQYNTMWPYIHMMPEETVQAAVDLKAKALLPVHWGKFTLSMHAWDEPVKRILQKAAELNMPVHTPKIGEPVAITSFRPSTKWWEF
jgi:L-ascorbate metabolism protein UlaG (beta-lactamase superfamily)